MITRARGLITQQISLKKNNKKHDNESQQQQKKQKVGEISATFNLDLFFLYDTFSLQLG